MNWGGQAHVTSIRDILCKPFIEHLKREHLKWEIEKSGETAVKWEVTRYEKHCLNMKTYNQENQNFCIVFYSAYVHK